jgi:murein DD-endopeptidase MepM/ murein hydrolase activator NlpD
LLSGYISSLPDKEKKGLPQGVKKGAKVKRGQHIAFIGQLYKNLGSVKFENTMVHFELYTNKTIGAFTNQLNKDDYINNIDNDPNQPFYRRNDLENPTTFLDKCE